MSEDRTDWWHGLQRYGIIHERISSYPDDDESPALMELCAKRDLFLNAARSGDAADLRAAIVASCVVPGPHVMTDGKAQRPEGTAQREARSEHIPTPEEREGEREPTAAELDDLADIIDEVVGEGHRDLELAVWKFVASRLSSPRVEEVRREALEEAARIFWRAGGRARVIEEIAKKMDLYDPRVGDMIRALKEDHP